MLLRLLAEAPLDRTLVFVETKRSAVRSVVELQIPNQLLFEICDSLVFNQETHCIGIFLSFNSPTDAKSSSSRRVRGSILQPAMQLCSLLFCPLVRITWSDFSARKSHRLGASTATR